MDRKPPRKTFSIAGTETDEQAVLERVRSARSPVSSANSGRPVSITVERTEKCRNKSPAKRSVAIRVYASVDFDKRVTNQAELFQVSRNNLQKWFVRNAKKKIRDNGLPIHEVKLKVKADRVIWLRTSVRLTDAEIERCYNLIGDKLRVESEMNCVGQVFSAVMEGLKPPSP